MAAGVPVIATDTPTDRELVVNGETGYLIPIGTRAGRAARARHTDRIFTDADVRDCLGKGGRGRVTHGFAAETALNACIEIYQSL
jgi:glycosyltransferase involved in cell wall biosynthesis